MWRGNSNAYFNTNNLTGNFYFNGSIPNIVRVGKIYPFSIHYSDFADQPERTTIGNFYDLTAIWAKDFNLTISKGNSNDVVTVNRTSSPIGRSTGSVSAGSNVISYGDKLYASVTQRSNIAYVRNISPSSVTVSDNTTITTSNGAYKSGKVYLTNNNSHVSGQLYRSSSPYGASIDSLSNGATIYWGDVINITYYYTEGWSGGTVSNLPRTYKPTNNGENLTLTMGAEYAVTSYVLYTSAGTNTTIVVSRNSSPNGHGGIGNLGNGAAIYQGDVLRIDWYLTNGASSGGALTVNGQTYQYDASHNFVTYTVGTANVSVTTAAATVQYTYSIYNNSGWTVNMDGTSVSNGSSRTWTTTSSYITITCDSAESTTVYGSAGGSVSKTLREASHTISRTKTNNTNYEKSYSISCNENYTYRWYSWYIGSDEPPGSAKLNLTNYYTATLTLIARSSATVKHDKIRYLFCS